MKSRHVPRSERSADRTASPLIPAGSVRSYVDGSTSCSDDDVDDLIITDGDVGLLVNEDAVWPGIVNAIT